MDGGEGLIDVVSWDIDRWRPSMTSPKLPDALYTVDDMTRYWAQESDFLKQQGQLKGASLRRHEFAMEELEGQTVWLFVEKLFADHPEVDAFSIERDDDPEDYYFVCVRPTGEEEFGGLGEDPSGAGEQLQMFVNDHRGMTYLVRALAASTLERDNWLEQAVAFLGAEWGAGREKALLEQGLANEPAPVSNKKASRL
jgi:hypothetical protein